MPIGTLVQPVGCVAAGQLPAALRATSTTFSGPHEGPASAWSTLFSRVAAQGLTPISELLAVDLSAPDAPADHADGPNQLKLTLL